MRIKVTQDHIDHGLRGSSTQDPVALALQDAGFIRPHVGMTEIAVDGQNGGFIKIYAPLPLIAFDFMMNFDNGEPVAPFTFEVEF